VGPFFHAASEKLFIYFSGKLDFFEIVDRNFRTRMPIAITHFYARDNDEFYVCLGLHSFPNSPSPPFPPTFPPLALHALLEVKIATTRMSFAFQRAEDSSFIHLASCFRREQEVSSKIQTQYCASYRAERDIDTEQQIESFPSSWKFFFQSAGNFRH
jgi:hypothetical protein